MEPSGVTFSPRSHHSPSGARRARLAVPAVLAAVMVTAGCQAPSATNAPSGGASAPSSGSPSAAPTTAPSLGDSGLFHIVGNGPVIARDVVPGRNAILPAAVTATDDGTYHAWI